DLGDTEMPEAPRSGGSITAASVASAVEAACRALRQKLDAMGERPRKPVEALGEVAPTEERKKYALHSFGAQFAEVEVDPDLGMVRVPRLVGAFPAGRSRNASRAPCRSRTTSCCSRSRGYAATVLRLYRSCHAAGAHHLRPDGVGEDGARGRAGGEAWRRDRLRRLAAVLPRSRRRHRQADAAGARARAAPPARRGRSRGAARRRAIRPARGR